MKFVSMKFTIQARVLVPVPASATAEELETLGDPALSRQIGEDMAAQMSERSSEGIRMEGSLVGDPTIEIVEV